MRNDWSGQPAVRLQVRTLDGFVARAEHEWPMARTRWTRLYLDPGQCALTRTPVAAEGSVEYQALGGGVTFSTPPLEQETEVTGPVAAKLHVSSSTSDADLFLVLRVFAPAGDEVVFQGAIDPHTPIGQGWLRVSHRVPHGAGQGLRVRRRHRRKLSNFKNELKGCGPFLHDDPRDRPKELFGGTTTLHAAPDRAAYLLLPIIPAPGSLQ